MNALFASEAKRFLLMFRGCGSAVGLVRHGGLAALFDAGLEGGLEGVSYAPDRHVVEVEAVGPARLQRLDPEVLLGDLGEEGLELAHVGVLRRGWRWTYEHAVLDGSQADSEGPTMN